MQMLRAGLFFGLAWAGPAMAQVPQSLLACSTRVADAERLKCYDDALNALSADARKMSEKREKEAAAAAAAAAATAAAAAEANAKAAEAAKTDAFGKRASAEERIEQVDATVAEILRDSANKAIFVLDNGQMWRQADGFGQALIKAGTAVSIKRGSMGSFRLVPRGSSRTVAVIRMR